MTDTRTSKAIAVIGGVDTHKDLHVAAVVDDHDRVLATASFSTTRQGYGKMLAWMRSHGDLRRVGVECTGSYGAGLLRFLQRAGIEVLEVTTPDRLDRRRTTISTPKTQPMPPSQASAPSHPAAGTAWWKPFVFSRFAASPPSPHDGSPCR